MKIITLASLMLKVRFLSWITFSQQGATIYTNSGMPVIVAVYQNGRRLKTSTGDKPTIPDIVPPEWNSPDGPPANPGTNTPPTELG